MILVFLAFSVVLALTIFVIKHNTVTVIGLSIYMILHFLMSIHSYQNINSVVNYYYQYDSIGVLLNILLSLLILPTIYHSKLYLERKGSTVKQKALFYAALIMFISTMTSVYFAENMAVLWVSIEATSLFITFLIYYTRNKDALEATWKYLFVSSVGLAISFIGILFLGIASNNIGHNTLNISTLISLAEYMNAMWLKIAFILIITGLSVKLSVIPLFSAAVDAKTIAASPVNALMSTALVNVGFIGIYNTFLIINKTSANHWAQHVLMIVAVLSIVLAAIQMTRIKRLKRLFAFSSMEHMGIVLLGFAVGGIGYYAAILHLTLHTLTKAGMFYQLGQIRNYYSSFWLSENGGYFSLNKLGSLALIIGLVSILAIPPSGMFISEFLTFKAMFLAGQYVIAIFVLIILTLIIYLFSKRIFYLLFGQPIAEFVDKNTRPNNFETISQFVLFGLVLYLGINPPVFFTNLIEASIAILN